MVSPHQPQPSDSLSFDHAIRQARACDLNGELEEAERGYRALLDLNPRHAELNHELGVFLLRANRIQQALPLLRTALEVQPKASQYWLSYVDALDEAGQRDAALAMLAQAQRRGLQGAAVEDRLRRWEGVSLSAADRQAENELVELFRQSRFAEMEQAAYMLTARSPALGGGWKALGTAIVMQGRVAEALGPLEKATSLLPADIEVQISLGNLLHELGRLTDAEKCYRQVLDMDPRNADAHRLLGITLRDQGRLELAEASCQQALTLLPDSAEATSNLASILLAQGRLGEAEHLYRQVLNTRPQLAEAHYDLATLLNGQYRFEEAEASFRRALELKPLYVPALNNLGVALNETGRHAEAEIVLRQAIDLSAPSPDLLCNLADTLSRLSRDEEADVCLEAAIAANPLDLRARSMRLFNLNYTGRHSGRYRVDQARQFGDAIRSAIVTKDRPATDYSSWLCTISPTRLRVGLVSGDFNNHPAGYFLESLVAHVNPERIELYAYATSHREDELTTRIRPKFAEWHSIAGVSDDVAAQKIHADGVHLLIDLSGHTAGNRLPVFARRPAPLQVSWLGYFATTGVHEMDYLIADPVGVRESEFDQFTETICYLPETRLCFTPSRASPDVRSLPAVRNGHITFGCFQNVAKISDNVLALWAKVFDVLPDTRMRVQCREMGYTASRDLLTRRMRRHGIRDAQVSLHGRVGRHAYLASYYEVDMVLDTFPYPGGTTTCEALWMGVPTLTLAGSSLLARQGASLLTAAGLPDWITTDEDGYLAQAVARAEDIAALSQLRASLRDHVGASPLFNAPRFSRQFEDTLWRLWREHQQDR